MGRFDGSILRRLVILLILFITHSAFADSGVIDGVKFPQYTPEGRLDYILYAEKAIPNGAIIDMTTVLVDFIADTADFEQLKDNRHVTLYSLKESFNLDPIINSFWKTYKQGSKGFCRTPKAVYNRLTGMVTGNKRVRFRFPEMDINGIGFDLDQKNSTFHIRNDVHVVLRGSYNDESSK
jgi:hypothetical protein